MMKKMKNSESFNYTIFFNNQRDREIDIKALVKWLKTWNNIILFQYGNI